MLEIRNNCFGPKNIYTILRQMKTGKQAACIFTDPTEASNWKEIETSDWSNFRFDEPPPKSQNME